MIVTITWIKDQHEIVQIIIHRHLVSQ